MLNEKETKSYWDERCKNLKECAVGFGDKNLEQQNGFYKEVSEFIFKNIDSYLDTIDYGCGIGRHSSKFTGRYLGIDMTKDMINMAIKHNPNRKYICSKQPYLSSDININWMQQFFTATVLQHCDDELVLKILKSVHNLKETEFVFFLYENSHNFVKPHVVGRKTQQYLDFISEAGFKIKSYNAGTHYNKKEQHSFVKVQV